MDALRACKPTLMDVTPNFADPKVKANYEKYPQVRENLKNKGITYNPKTNKSYTKKKTTDKVATDGYRKSTAGSRIKKAASTIKKVVGTALFGGRNSDGTKKRIGE